MPSAAVRITGVLAVLAALTLGSARADDADPEYKGKKVSQWIDVVQNDTSARQRALGVEALGSVWAEKRHKDAIPNVCRALRVDASAAVRAQAARVLAGLLPKDHDLGAKALVDALGAEKESRVRKEIIAAMAKSPDVCAAGVEPLAAALKDADPAVKVAAAEALALAGGQAKTMAKSAAPGLVPLLRDADKSVRMAAVYALGRIQPEGASAIAEAMAAMLAAERDADMRRELVAALGLLDEKSEPVVAALKAALTAVRLTDPALQDLRRAKVPDAVLARLDPLKDKNVPRNDFKKEIDKILTADEAKQFRDAISDRVLTDSDEEAEVRRRAARVLGTFGTAAAGAADALLAAATGDRVKKDIRVDAVRAFGSALGPAGVKARLKDLRPLLEPENQPDFEVRLAVVDEIAALGWEHLGADLAAADPAVRAAAHETLVALRQRRADPQLKVREAANLAIRKIEKKPEPKKDPDPKAP